MWVGDHFVILRRGLVFGDFSKDEVSLEQLVQMMAGGAELDSLTHELERVAADDPEMRKAVEELQQEVKAAPTTPETVAVEPVPAPDGDGEAGTEA